MTAEDALQKYFGFPHFREGQEEIIAEILDGTDTLVIMPTGGGKSLCFQLPALLQTGVTLVVSPLIALMKDQVDALQARGIPADFINSSLTPAEQRQRLQAMREGALKLVYLAPERFRHEGFLRALEEIEVSLFAVDEAHCISQWGHDFRPDYYRMGQMLDKLRRPQVVALTATATPAVQEDILRCLGIPSARVFVAGFSRPNLSLRVCQVANDVEKYARLQDLVSAQKTGIVYCATRKKVEAVALELREWGISHVAYHGGMDEAARTAAQDKFIRREADVAVATNAFGMGIDRSDLRFIAHFEIPGSIEAYYQEVGRAGRDGLPSVCELYFLHPDVRVQEFFIEGANPGREIIGAIWNTLRQRADKNGELTLTIEEIADLTENCKNSMAVSSALAVLGRAGYLERFDLPGSNRRGTRVLQDLPASRLKIDWAALDRKENVDRERLRQMVDYAYGRGCRQQYLLRAFGETSAPACGACDRCQERPGDVARPPRAEEIVLMQKVLSCVARMSRRAEGKWEGRYGRQRIAQVLAGSRSRAVLDAGLEKLSTYGLLAQQGEAGAMELLRAAIDGGLLVVDSGTYPVVALTSRGELAMRGNGDYALVWPTQGSSQKGRKQTPLSRKDHSSKTSRGRGEKDGTNQEGSVVLSAADAALFEKLREKRRELANTQDVAAFVIASDSLLRVLAMRRPLSPEALLTIPGVRERKASMVAPLLETIRTFTREAVD